MQFLKTSSSNLVYLHIVGRDSVIGIATGYGLDDSGIESRWGQKFPSRPTLGPTKLPVQWVPEVKAAGAWGWPPTPSTAEVKERVELCFCSPSVPSWPVVGWTLPLWFHSSLYANCRVHIVACSIFVNGVIINFILAKFEVITAVLLKIEFFWNVTLCWWTIVSKDSASRSPRRVDLLTLKMGALLSPHTLRSVHPSTPHSTPEDWRIRYDSSWNSYNQPHMMVLSVPDYPKDFRKYIKANRPNIFVWTLCRWRPPFTSSCAVNPRRTIILRRFVKCSCYSLYSNFVTWLDIKLRDNEQ